MKIGMKFGLRALYLGLVLLVIAACRTSPVYNVTNAELGAPPRATLAQVNGAIKKAGANLGWQMRDAGANKMIGELHVRSHVAVVEIAYDTKRFSIAYRDSQELQYDGSQIHSNYNGWIQNLERQIKSQASTIGA